MKRIIVSILFLAAACFASDARKVTGSVMCGETKLAGVIVTDGTNFTQTLKNGKFSFDINDNAEFVYIVTPAGYTADYSSGVPEFYKPAQGQSKFDFKLSRMSGGLDYHIIAVGDPQVYSDEQFDIFAGAPMADLCKTTKSLDGTVVGLALGDISWDRIDILDMYKKEITRTGIPFYPVIGNHDHEAYVKGDKEASATYRSKMGPENYAFHLGKDIVIVLDNIIYDTNWKSEDGYTDEAVAWVRSLMKFIPPTAEIYIAQHVPTGYGRHKIRNASSLLEIMRGRKTTILSAHLHTNSIREVEKNITEHNVAAICGAWWDTMHCTDGTPRGYKVFTKYAGKLSWYYKPVDHTKNHIAEAFGLDECAMHPGSIIVNVWDYDPNWKVEWYEDGTYKGKMDKVKEISPVFHKEIKDSYAAKGEDIPSWKSARPGSHNFAATPSRYAKSVTVTVESRFGQKWMQTFDLTESIEKHLGCSEATIDNIKSLVDAGATFLKLDLVTDINGDVTVGTKDGPLMIEVLDVIDEYIAKEGRSTVGFNFEINTAAGKEEGKSVPYFHAHADFVMMDLWARYMGDRLMITGSDYRSLNHLNEKYPEVDLAFKVAMGTEDADKAMARLKFTPKWISFHHQDINKDIIKKYHDKGMYVSVWGIDDDETAAAMETLRPDAVIYR